MLGTDVLPATHPPSSVAHLAKIEYFSSPLKGTEGRDRLSTGLQLTSPSPSPSVSFGLRGGGGQIVEAERHIKSNEHLNARLRDGWLRLKGLFNFAKSYVFKSLSSSVAAIKQDGTVINSKDTSDNNANYHKYTQADIDQLIEDILHQVQMHQVDITAHRDRLQQSGRWHPSDFTRSELERMDHDVDQSPMFVVRSSSSGEFSEVSQSALAHAVEIAADHLAHSRGAKSSLPSAVLDELNVRLAKVVRPQRERNHDAMPATQGVVPARTESAIVHALSTAEDEKVGGSYELGDLLASVRERQRKKLT